MPDQADKIREARHISMLPIDVATRVKWQVIDGLTDYESCVMDMEKRAQEIAENKTPEAVWLVEHPPIYTAGTSADKADLLEANTFPIYESGRGGEYTYHGPGQRIVYVMLDLNRRKKDVRAFVMALEEWIIQSLADFNIKAERRSNRVGVWVMRPDKPKLAGGITHEDKIAAIGIRLRKWVSFHGISINVEPQLDHYQGIVPCGIKGHGVTSLVDLGLPVTMADLDLALKSNFEAIFGKLD